VNLSSHSTAELKAKHTRLLTAACKVWAEIQRREGSESIEVMATSLPQKQRSFLLALWNTQHKRMSIIDLEKKVWGTKDHESVPQETVRNLVWRLGNSIEKLGIPVFIDEVKRENGDIWGYKVKRKK